ncbi:hypothetical protein Saro_2095 [Novosphingobium aromaticivorans DSM 12444]|uniref:Cthe-2314-like HEPN domain-containing protein n=1 Tax=Novosphingobium aromaticivorans (strain ATCC 700278 / DSM 12444 / CCUG 56034 / CIP 105152 / NBRC 16084 / F199) TaxID=279238 RepID=Q2G6I9_NOVAD|nr:hypothetical protein Saro_2095 [Novosphingobium aromaticivorans DSM 12444]
MDLIAGYRLSQAERAPYLKFHDFITNPQPSFISTWRADPKLGRWYHRLVNGVLGDVQSTFGCVLYHVTNIQRMESAIEGVIAKLDKSILGNVTVGGGDTSKINFEYQAFIFAYRRVLDYLARALASYFRIDCNSFRTFDRSLKTTIFPSVSAALVEVHRTRLPLFDFVASEGNRKSVRDKLAHYEAISAGFLNLSIRNGQLVGGGEELGLATGHTISLSHALDRRVQDLRETVKDFLYTFVSEARKLEAQP